jgi:hypothetical protein
MWNALFGAAAGGGGSSGGSNTTASDAGGQFSFGNINFGGSQNQYVLYAGIAAAVVIALIVMRKK